MIRFGVAVLVATVLHAVACILVPPFEFADTSPACFFFAFTSGLMAFPVLLAVVLLPLQRGLRAGSCRGARSAPTPSQPGWCLSRWSPP
jgi:hypothetical protein